MFRTTAILLASIVTSFPIFQKDNTETKKKEDPPAAAKDIPAKEGSITIRIPKTLPRIEIHTVSPKYKPLIPSREDIDKYFLDPSRRTIDTYYHDKNGKYGLAEIIGFYVDNTRNYVDRSQYFDSEKRISREELGKIKKWYEDVAAQAKNEKEKNIFLEFAAELEKVISNLKENKEEDLNPVSFFLGGSGYPLTDENSIPTPLPGPLALFDKNGDGKVDIDEARELYEAKTGKKLEVDEEGQLTEESREKLIDFYYVAKQRFAPNRHYLSEFLWNAGFQIVAQHHKNTGRWYPPPAEKLESEIIRPDALSKEKK